MSKSGMNTAALLTWYRQNARSLPWRSTNDPYRIWVSEIMLQQTRVAAVLDYYARFLEAFPSVEALANAPENLLMKLWEGLGYYSRARNLQACARIVSEQYGGHFPADGRTLQSLPGIGAYTAGAIASAAFGLPIPAVDGNVLRVAARLHDCHSDISRPNVRRSVRNWVAAAMPADPNDIRIFNQSLMELGATVCVPNGPPNCDLCPLRDNCQGLEKGTAPSLPVRPPKKRRRIEDKTVFLLLRHNTVALHQRPKTGLLAGLWEFPNVNSSLDESTAASAVADWGLTPLAWHKRLSAKHIFTHVEWHMTVYVLEVAGPGPADFVWADHSTLSNYAIPSAFSVCCQEAHDLLS